MPRRGRALPQRDAGPRPREGARPPADRARAAGARARREGRDRHADPQHQPHGRHDALGRDRASATATRACPTTRSTSRSRASAGQSFGAFLARGVTLELIGDTNDYSARACRAGASSVQPSPKFRGEPEREHHHRQRRAVRRDRGRSVFPRRRGRALRGAQLGRRARSSKASGDHGCEYMTGGTVVVLGATGRNFAAGMSRRHRLRARRRRRRSRSAATRRWSTLEPVLTEAEQDGRRSPRELLRTWAVATKRSLRELIERHVRYTGSTRARAILDDWAQYRARSSSRCSRTSTGAR